MRLRLFRPAPPAEEIVPVRLDDGTDVAVRWVRDPRARRLRLLVSGKGPRLTLPPRASRRVAQAFVEEHRGWLAAQLAKQPPVRGPFGRGTDVALPLRGVELPIAWLDGRFVQVARGEHAIEIRAPERAADAQLRAALREFYRQQARADLGLWMPRYLPGLPRPPRTFGFRTPSSIWGSLSPSGAVSLDLALVLGRPTAFEYVLVHELCHLIHADHSRAFWREVESRFPAWREERGYLRGDGHALKATLARLIA